MKIAIKGHILRGKEVIQTLESLGGINTYNYSGNNFGAYYELHGNSIICMSTKSDNIKYYTLEEFEKEFPFAIGDKVTIASKTPYTIIALEYYMDRLCYKLDSGLYYIPEVLTPYKEMKEKRNITLNINKAKEWYAKGGELREVALQAYSEEELTKVELPKSWKEFCRNYPLKRSEAVISTESIIMTCDCVEIRDPDCDREICPSIKSAEAHLAMIQLEQLRDCWRQGWEPIWDCSEKWCIRLWGNELAIGITTNISRFLTFPTKEMAKEFLKCFRDLIEQAEDLI